MSTDYSTMTEREWLVSQNLAKPTRGRLSKDAHAALDKAKAAGAVFKVIEIPVRSGAAEKSVKSKSTASPVGKRAESKRAKGISPKVVVKGSASKVATEKRPDVDPKAVRAWAVEQGIEIAQRGRLNSETVAAYLEAVKPEDRPEVVTSTGFGPTPARVYSEGTKFEGEVNGKTILTTAGNGAAACMRSGYSIGWCGNHPGSHRILVASASDPVDVVAKR